MERAVIAVWLLYQGRQKTNRRGPAFKQSVSKNQWVEHGVIYNILKWPATATKREWGTFDKVVVQVLKATLTEDIWRWDERRARSTIIWTTGVDYFGKEERKPKAGNKSIENIHLKETGNLQAHPQTSDEEKTVPKEISDKLKEELQLCIGKVLSQ